MMKTIVDEKLISYFFAVGKAKQVGEHPKPGTQRVLLADVAVDQQPDFF